MHTSDEATIRELIAEQETAMRTADAQTLVARYAPEAVLFDLAPPLRKSGPEVRDADRLRKWFAGFDDRVAFDVRDLDVTVDGDVAFCHSLNRMAANPLGAPDGFELWFRSTVCYRRIEGRWLVTHEHTSTPFDMDGSFRASVDLRP
jgi:ketosteroid isomerase-like protein